MGREIDEFERRAAQQPRVDATRFRRFLEREVWPQVPPEVIGRPVPREEWDRIVAFDYDR
jgi:hypothetical protein